MDDDCARAKLSIGILAWIPIALLSLTLGLSVLVARAYGLSMLALAVFGAALALSPLTQLLHGYGVLDHHHVELIFWLLACLLAGRWFSRGGAHWAVAAGLAVGLAPAFHNSLFLICIPLCLAGAALWWLGRRPRHLALMWFGTLAGLALAVLPTSTWLSAPVAFYHLGWFHVVAVMVAVTWLVLSFLIPRNRSGLWLLFAGATAGAAAWLALSQIGHGLSFVRADLDYLSAMGEAQSPFGLTHGEAMGLDLVVRLYGLPIFLVPLVLIYLLWQAWKSASPERIVIAAFAIVGMALMVYQFRFHYFGYTFLLLGAVAMIAQLLSRLRLKPRVGGLALAAGVVALQGPALHSLAQLPAPGADVIWFHLPQVIRPLANRCRQDGGVVLADQNLGHYLRWGTECSVIGSNLMMGPADFEAISRGNALLRANLSQAAHSGIDYVVAGDWPRIFGDSGKQPWPLERVLLDLPAGAGAGELPTQQVPLIRVFEVPND